LVRGDKSGSDDEGSVRNVLELAVRAGLATVLEVVGGAVILAVFVGAFIR
jgi:hypothetical protein